MVKWMLNNQARVDRVFHAIGDPTRRRILEHLGRGASSVSDLAEPLEVTLAAVVQHLQILEESGIIRSEKQGRVRTCQLAPGGLRPAEDWIAARRMDWEKRFDRLEELVDGPKQRKPGAKRRSDV